MKFTAVWLPIKTPCLTNICEVISIVQYYEIVKQKPQQIIICRHNTVGFSSIFLHGSNCLILHFVHLTVRQFSLVTPSTLSKILCPSWQSEPQTEHYYEVVFLTNSLTTFLLKDP